MAVIPMKPVGAPDTSDEVSQPKRRRWLPIVFVVLVAWLVTFGVRWRTTAAPLTRWGSGSGAPGHVGTPVLFGNPSLDPVVQLTKAEAVVKPGSALAAVTVLVCPLVNPAIGAEDGPPPPGCVDEFPAKLGGSPGAGTYTVVVIVPLTRGKIEVDGVEVWFRDGWRTGHQHIGETDTVVVQ